MAKLLAVHNAELNTASITIRTLQIEGRQVTLAVFRQLQDEDIITDGPSLKGVGWGHVNYLMEGWDDSRYSGRCIHLVWQKGNELRRCLVHQSVRPRHFYFPAVERDCTPEGIERSLKTAEQWEKSESNKSTYEYYRNQAAERQRKLDRWKRERVAAEAQFARDEAWGVRRNVLVAPLFELPQLFIAV